MKALIVDDERKSRELLSGMLLSLLNNIEEIKTAENVDEAKNILKNYSPDVIYLDIEMPGENGFALLADYEILPFDVIFITAYKEYALEAFQFGACDYILKPFNAERIVKAMKRIEDRKIEIEKNLKVQEYKKLSLATINGFNIVEIEDIEYCKAEGNYTRVFFKDKRSLLVSKNLMRFENLLTQYDFLRIHRSSIINIKYISSYTRGKSPHITLNSGAQLEVSPQKKEKLLSILLKV